MFFKQKRVLILYLLFAGTFLLLLGRLFQIQIIDGAKYAQQAVAQRQQTVNYVQFPRGQILDRKLRPLTNVEEQPAAVVFPLMMPEDRSEAASFLSSVLSLPVESVTNRLNGDPVVLKTGLSEAEVSLIEKTNLPGVYVLPVVPRYQRNWPAVHMIGNVGQISEEEYQQLKDREQDYQREDVIGKNGLERQYEEVLRGGESAKIAAMVDVHGQHVKGAGFTLIPDKIKSTDLPTHVVTTLDQDYQKITEEALEGYEGAAVVLDVWNGDILASASSPEYDPSMSETPEGKDAYVNKALQNYPPASVFKILIMLAALEEGLVQPEDQFICSGEISLPSGRKVSCWNQEGHGEITFAQGAAYSCNPVFIQAGLELGGEKILEYAGKLGLRDDKIIGYDLPLTSHFQFNNRVEGDLVNVIMGEKGVSLSPLLVAKLIAQVANGGFSITPRLVSELHNDQGEIVKEYPSTMGERIITEESTGAVKSVLHLAVEEGTGTAAQVPGIGTAGKTGSSETAGVWFAGFAPLDVPKWAVVVFVQKGTSGGREAAPIFKEIIDRLARLEGMIQ